MALGSATFLGAGRWRDFTLPGGMRGCLWCHFSRLCSRCVYRVLRAFVGIDMTFTGVRFHGTRSSRKQGSFIARSFPPHQEPYIKENTPEEPAGDGGGAASDSAEDQNEENPFPVANHDPRCPLLGNHHCKSGADASDWAVRFHLVRYAHRDH